MTLTTILLSFFVPMIGAYVGTKLTSLIKSKQKTIDLSYLNYSEARLRRMQND